MSAQLAMAGDAAGGVKQDGASAGMAGPLTVRTYRRLEELPQSFCGLFDETSRQSVFMTLPWFRNFVETALNDGDKVKVYAVSAADDFEKPAGLFLARSMARKNALFSLRKLTSLSNYYSPCFGPHIALRESLNANTLNALAAAISAENPQWDAIEIKPLDVDAASFSQLATAFRSAGFIVQTFFCAGNWYEPIHGRSFQEYFEGLRSSVRNIAKSKNKKIERSGRVRCEIITGIEGLEKGIAIYNQVYEASWKVQEPYHDFMPGLIRTLAAQGSLRLGVAYADGQPAAAQVWIVHAGVASIYKMAYSQKFRDLSVGTYLTTRLMEYAIDIDKVNEVDYLTGDDRYKKDWMSKRRERWGILALNPRTPRGLFAIGRHVGGRKVKRVAMSIAARFSHHNDKPSPVVPSRT